VDLNGDGNQDILSGSYSRSGSSMAGLFQVLMGQKDGTFKEAAELKGTDNEPLIIPADDKDQIIEKICTRPTAIDWDADGDLDLIVGNFAGTFYLFTGEGKGRFSPKPTQIKTGSDPLRIDGAHSDPFPVDWDRDGDIDLLSGSSNGGVQWAENKAGAGKSPELAPFRELINPGKQVEYGEPLSEGDLTGPTRATRIWVDDVNSDDKLDVLVGDSVTLVAVANGLSKEEFQKKKKQWDADYRKVSEAYQAAQSDADKLPAAQENFQKVYNQRSEFITETMTGFVWLYLQK